MARQVMVFAVVSVIGVACGGPGADTRGTVETREPLAASKTEDGDVVTGRQTAAADRAAAKQSASDAVVGPPPTASSGGNAGADLAVADTSTVTATLGSVAAPVLTGLTPTASTVTVSWDDRSDTELKFIVYRRGIHGTWEAVHMVPTVNMVGPYSYNWVDTFQGLSAQCYCIAAVSDLAQSASREQCTIRPDPSRSPQTAPPQQAVDWHGLSPINDAAAHLHNIGANRNLQFEDRTWGVSLGWTDIEQNNVKLERQNMSPYPLMRGEPLALRVWGGGWLAYGDQTFGVGLILSDWPAYQWYILGDAPLGSPFGSDFALWNAAANDYQGDYLVHSDQTFGIGLEWYQKTLPYAGGGSGGGTGDASVYICGMTTCPTSFHVESYVFGAGCPSNGGNPNQTKCVTNSGPFNACGTPRCPGGWHAARYQYSVGCDLHTSTTGARFNTSWCVANSGSFDACDEQSCPAGWHATRFAYSLDCDIYTSGTGSPNLSECAQNSQSFDACVQCPAGWTETSSATDLFCDHFLRVQCLQ